MRKKNNTALTLDEALSRLAAVQAASPTDDVPFLAECSTPGMLQLCDIKVSAAGASDPFRTVSRGGVPVIVVWQFNPSKDRLESDLPYLTANEVLRRLQAFRAELPGETPVVASGTASYSLQLCDIQLDRHGIGNVYKRVSRGGLPLALVTFGPPAALLA